MVRSIRFWCLLFKVLQLSEKPGTLLPTNFGHHLLGTETGWDPYLEDTASLWLLHWQIFKPPFTAVSWNLAFSFITLPSFSVQELSEGIYKIAEGIENLSKIAKGSFQKDASCLIRMYFSENVKSALRCPFTELRLIEHAADSLNPRQFRLSLSTQSTLPDLIFLSAVFDFAELWFPGQRSLSLSRIAYAPNSPGMAFRLSETECGHRIMRAMRNFQGIIFTETDGIRQIQFNEEPGKLSSECLSRYYGGLR